MTSFFGRLWRSCRLGYYGKSLYNSTGCRFGRREKRKGEIVGRNTMLASSDTDRRRGSISSSSVVLSGNSERDLIEHRHHHGEEGGNGDDDDDGIPDIIRFRLPIAAKYRQRLLEAIETDNVACHLVSEANRERRDADLLALENQKREAEWRRLEEEESLRLANRHWTVKEIVERKKDDSGWGPPPPPSPASAEFLQMQKQKRKKMEEEVERLGSRSSSRTGKRAGLRSGGGRSSRLSSATTTTTTASDHPSSREAAEKSLRPPSSIGSTSSQCYQSALAPLSGRPPLASAGRNRASAGGGEASREDSSASRVVGSGGGGKRRTNTSAAAGGGGPSATNGDLSPCVKRPTRHPQKHRKRPVSGGEHQATTPIAATTAVQQQQYSRPSSTSSILKRMANAESIVVEEDISVFGRPPIASRANNTTSRAVEDDDDDEFGIRDEVDDAEFEDDDEEDADDFDYEAQCELRKSQQSVESASISDLRTTQMEIRKCELEDRLSRLSDELSSRLASREAALEWREAVTERTEVEISDLNNVESHIDRELDAERTASREEFRASREAERKKNARPSHAGTYRTRLPSPWDTQRRTARPQSSSSALANWKEELGTQTDPPINSGFAPPGTTPPHRSRSAPLVSADGEEEEEETEKKHLPGQEFLDAVVDSKTLLMEARNQELQARHAAVMQAKATSIEHCVATIEPKGRQPVEEEEGRMWKYLQHLWNMTHSETLNRKQITLNYSYMLKDIKAKYVVEKEKHQLQEWLPEIFRDRQRLLAVDRAQTTPHERSRVLLQEATEKHREAQRQSWDLSRELRQQLLELQREQRQKKHARKTLLDTIHGLEKQVQTLTKEPQREDRCDLHKNHSTEGRVETITTTTLSSNKHDNWAGWGLTRNDREENLEDVMSLIPTTQRRGSSTKVASATKGGNTDEGVVTSNGTAAVVTTESIKSRLIVLKQQLEYVDWSIQDVRNREEDVRKKIECIV